ncbi:MAG TPA: amidohydrolase family protein [Pyrinomonadaceae bacterium]|nr:amidohydrolase family protein [Pyrinomonadaceae bacterium]
MIVDSDAHINEPMEAFERFLEEPYRARRPRIIEDTLGLTRILLEGRLYPDPRLRQARGGRHGGNGRGAGEATGARGVIGCRGRIDGIPAGAADPEARLRDLDLEGIDAQVAYGNLGVAVSALADKDFAVAMSRACNDYYADFCRASPDRLKCMAALPLQDIPASVAELKRAVTELGHAGAALPPNVNGRNLDHADFYPLYEEAERLGVPLGVHWGNGAYLTAAGSERFDTHFMTHAFGHPFEQMIALTCVVCGGVLERFPRLRFAFLEAGCGWLPYWLERLREHYRRRAAEVPLMRREPLEYVTGGGCYFGAESDEAMLPAVLDLIGDDFVLFGSDYPHSDSAFPHAVEKLRARADISEEARRKILGRNGLRFLGLGAGAALAPGR